MVLPRHVLGGPNEKLNIAGIGIGGQGASDLHDVNSENIVALCDVDWDYAAKTFANYPKAKRYKDYREMLDKEKNIDAVVIGTPDHRHADRVGDRDESRQACLLRKAADPHGV